MPLRNSPHNVLTTGEVEMTLGGRIQKARANSGMSMQMLANLLGVKAATLKAWENDQSEPRVNKINAMSGILGVSPTFFLAEEGNDGIAVKASQGRQEKIIHKIQEEFELLAEQHKALNLRVRKLKTLISKLK